MANTWNKIKKKLTFKKKGRGSNRRRNGRGKNRNRSNSDCNVSSRAHHQRHRGPMTPKAVQQHRNSITTLPNKTSKRRSSKSNIFGCFASVPQERQNYNVQPQRKNYNANIDEGYGYDTTQNITQPQEINNNNNNNNIDTNNHIQPQQIKNKNNIDATKSSDEMKGEREKSKSNQGQPAAEQLQSHDIGKSVSPETGGVQIKFNRAQVVNVPKPRPISPSKSKTSSTYFTATTLTDIQDNISMINEIESSPKQKPEDRDSYNCDHNQLLSTPQNNQNITTLTSTPIKIKKKERERGHIHDSEMKYNGYRDHYDGCYGTTPTPQTHTAISNISYASSSELCGNGNTGNVSHDIYDGVIEVENDKIIEEGDMSNYYSNDHGDDDEVSVKHEHEQTDEDDDDDDDDINHSSTNYSGQRERGSVIIRTPRDIVDEFSNDHNTSVELPIGLEHASIDVDIDEDIMSINNHNHQNKQNSIYQNIFEEQEYIQELNDELKRNGYDNPESVLQQLWQEQIEIERGAQILKILKYFCHKV